MQNKLWAMNAEMEKMNWKLSKDVETHVSKRVKGELVRYDNFIKVYPTDKSVLRFLHELKSKEKFKCRKCKNAKYKEETADYTRICTVCGNRESATAATLLQGTKIDKQMALYLTYLFLTSPKVNVKGLSEEFDMRIATIYDLRKKVFAISNKEVIKDWEGLLLSK